MLLSPYWSQSDVRADYSWCKAQLALSQWLPLGDVCLILNAKILMGRSRLNPPYSPLAIIPLEQFPITISHPSLLKQKDTKEPAVNRNLENFLELS